MSKFFEQSFGDVAQGKKVFASSVMDMVDDENGKAVVSYEHRAFVAQTKMVEVDGEMRSTTTQSISMDVHEIDELIAALQSARQEIYVKRMADATAWFLADKAERDAEEGAAHIAFLEKVAAM